MYHTPEKSRRGVYYDLSKSPHGYTLPCGDVLKFSSAKKRDVYIKRLKAAQADFEKAMVHAADFGAVFAPEVRARHEEELYYRVYREMYKNGQA